MFLEFKNESEFYKNYIRLFSTRFTYGSLTMENSKDSISGSKRAIEVLNNMRAFENLVHSGIEKIYPHDIQNVNADVTRNLNGMIDGYRKINILIQGANFETPEPRQVPMSIMVLLDNYYNIWNVLNSFEREARFHIGLIRIHPFEDGNGRTGRILMNYHLCKDDFAPVIISLKDREKYFKFIENKDYDGFADYIENASRKELEVMRDVYSNFSGIEEENKQLIKRKF